MLDIAEIFEQAIGALRVSAYEIWRYLETLWNFLKPYLTPSYIENSAYEIWKHESPLVLIFIFLFIFLIILAAFTVFLKMATDKEEGLEEVVGDHERLEPEGPAARHEPGPQVQHEEQVGQQDGAHGRRAGHQRVGAEARVHARHGTAVGLCEP